MSILAFHIVRAFVEITHTRDVILAMFTDDITLITDNDRSVPDRVLMVLIALQDRVHDDHVVLACHCAQEHGRATSDSGFSKFAPRLLLAGAHKKGQVCMTNQELLSREKKTIRHASCKQRTLTPIAAAASIMVSILRSMASYCAATGAVVGRTIEF